MFDELYNFLSFLFRATIFVRCVQWRRDEFESWGRDTCPAQAKRRRKFIFSRALPPTFWPLQVQCTISGFDEGFREG